MKIAAAFVLSSTLLLASGHAFASPIAGRECARHTTGAKGSLVRIKARYTTKGVLLGRKAEWIPPYTDTGNVLYLKVEYDNPTIEGLGAPSRVYVAAQASISSFAGAFFDFDADGATVRRPLTHLSYYPGGMIGTSYQPPIAFGSALMTGSEGKEAYSMDLLPQVETMNTLRVRLSQVGFRPMEMTVDLSTRPDRDRMFAKTWPKILQEVNFWRRCPAF